MNKLTRLEKSVDKLVQVLSSTKEDALKLVSQAEKELVRAKADYIAKWEKDLAEYKETETKYMFLQKYCLQASTYVDKILNQ